jgi:hypothetical protein
MFIMPKLETNIKTFGIQCSLKTEYGLSPLKAKSGEAKNDREDEEGHHQIRRKGGPKR